MRVQESALATHARKLVASGGQPSQQQALHGRRVKRGQPATAAEELSKPHVIGPVPAFDPLPQRLVHFLGLLLRHEPAGRLEKPNQATSHQAPGFAPLVVLS